MGSNKMNETMATKLMFSPIQNLSDERRYYLTQLHSQLPKMKENQLDITGVELTNLNDEELIATIFIRTTVEKPITLKPSTILLIDEDQRVCAKATIQPDKLGTLLPGTSTPWTIHFSKESFLHQAFDKLSSWSVAFDQSDEHRLDLSDMKEEKVSEYSKAKLTKIIQSQPLQQDELSLIGLSAKMNDDNLAVTLLIRNGTQKNLTIHQLPLKFYDASGELSAQGTFKLDKLTILANTSKPISLIFPASSLLKNPINLSKWSIRHHE